MSKKQPQETKQKEFHTKSFAKLRGLTVEPPQPPPGEPPAVKKKAPPAAAPAGSEDLSLFIREMADVRRLGATPAKEKKKPEEPPRPLVRKIDEEERQVFLNAVKDIDQVFSEEEDPLKPAPRNRMRELRRGRIRIDLELDLHGLTREEALDALSRFVTGASRRGQEGVLVITGKGNHSAEEPVLQGAVASWLREKGKALVAEFAAAPREMGGAGALVVFLKKQPPA